MTSPSRRPCLPATEAGADAERLVLAHDDRDRVARERRALGKAGGRRRKVGRQFAAEHTFHAGCCWLVCCCVVRVCCCGHDGYAHAASNLPHFRHSLGGGLTNDGAKGGGSQFFLTGTSLTRTITTCGVLPRASAEARRRRKLHRAGRPRGGSRPLSLVEDELHGRVGVEGLLQKRAFQAHRDPLLDGLMHHAGAHEHIDVALELKRPVLQDGHVHLRDLLAVVHEPRVRGVVRLVEADLHAEEWCHTRRARLHVEDVRLTPKLDLNVHEVLHLHNAAWVDASQGGRKRQLALVVYQPGGSNVVLERLDHVRCLGVAKLEVLLVDVAVGVGVVCFAYHVQSKVRRRNSGPPSSVGSARI
eukprot:scaffold9943_cov60-Phaeocystis_antarctica.AAC.2